MKFSNSFNSIFFSLIFILLTCIQSPIYTQKNSNNILLISKLTHPNNNILDQGDILIPMIDIKLSESVYHYFIDTTTSQIYLRTRKMNFKKNRYKAKGHIASIDLYSHKMQWQETINYNKAFASIKNRYMIRRKPNRNMMIDLTTGNELWEVKNKIYYTFSDKDVAIGYKLKGVKLQDKSLQGLDMKTGNVLWERELDGFYGWKEMFALNDSTLIISGSGIHSIQYNNGLGWSIEQTAGKRNINFWTGSKNFYNLGSNIVLDTIDGFMYQAAEELLKFNTDGEVEWKTALPDKTLSKMFLWQSTEHLYLINTGGSDESVLGYSHIGQAYTMCIDKTDGSILSHEYIKLAKKDYVYDVKYLEDGQVHALSKKKIQHIDIKTGRVVNNIPLLLDEFGKYKSLITADCYTKDGDTFKSLNDKYDYGIINRKEETLHYINAERKFMNLHLEDIYIRHELIPDTLTLYHSVKQNSYLTNSIGIIVAEIDVLKFPQIVEHNLYSIDKEILRIFNLEAFR